MKTEHEQRKIRENNNPIELKSYDRLQMKNVIFLTISYEFRNLPVFEI